MSQPYYRANNIVALGYGALSRVAKRAHAA
jgi:hypothetical protein